MSSRESLLLAIPCFCVTDYGYLQCVTSFFYYRVEVPASSEPLERINSLVWAVMSTGSKSVSRKLQNISFVAVYFFFTLVGLPPLKKKKISFTGVKNFFFLMGRIKTKAPR